MSHDAHLIESEVSSETVFKGALLNVRKDRVLLPNGQESIREYIVHPGAVVVLAFLPNGNLLFERQFRYPLRRVFLEQPAARSIMAKPSLTPPSANSRKKRATSPATGNTSG